MNCFAIWVLVYWWAAGFIIKLVPYLGPSAGTPLVHTMNNNLKDQEDKLEMFPLQKKCLICSSALYQSFHMKGKLSVGNSGLNSGVSVQCHLSLTAATVGSLEKSTGTLSNILKILVNNQQLSAGTPAPSISLHVLSCSRTGLRSGAIRAFRKRRTKRSASALVK